MPSAGGPGLDQRRLEPARWVPARSRAGVPISCEEMGRKKPRGVPPGPPFFKARSLLARSFWRGGAQRGGCWAISEPIYVP